MTCSRCKGAGWFTNYRNEPQQCPACLEKGMCPLCGHKQGRRAWFKQQWCERCGCNLYHPLTGERDPDMQKTLFDDMAEGLEFEPLTLRPYQIGAVAGICEQWDAGKWTLAALSTGTGKTIIFLAALARHMKPGDRALIIAHRQELIYQPRDRILRYFPDLADVGIVMANENQADRKVVIATIQTLCANGRLDEIFAHGKITHAVTDECFVAGTLVGGAPIETLNVGDWVPSFDSARNNPEVGYVTRTFVRNAPDVLYEIEIAGRKIVCTESHPFYCGAHTWKQACALQEGDYVIQCTIQSRGKESVSHETDENVHLPLVRKRISEQSEIEIRPIEKREGLLLDQVRACLQEQAELDNDGCYKSQVCISPNEEKESYAQSQDQSQNEVYAESKGMEASGSRGERKALACRSTADGLRPRMGDRIPSDIGRKAHQPGAPTYKLQAGHSQSRLDDRDRDRWGQPLVAETTSTRSEKREGVTRARVDSVTILKRGRDKRFEQVCPDGLVYNIEVTPWNTYQVNGVVAHNCHHSTAPTYLDVYDRLRAHNPEIKHLGVTATPRRTDGDGLSKVYDSVAYRMGIKQSIKSGALCPFVALGFRLPVNIGNVRRVGQGWDDEALGDVLKAHNAEDLIIAKWEEHTLNKPTICFTASVAQAHSLAQRFREAGYAFEAADGTTPKAERQAILKRFKKGTTTGVVNCALWTEGFDAPQIECLVQVRPTKSDLVYMQMMGRALRVFPGKQVATILDFVPDGDRDIRQARDMLGKPKEQREAEKAAADDGVILGAFGINSKGEGVDGDPDEIVVEVLDYLTSSRLAWTFDGLVASATVGDKATLAITMPDDTAASRVEKADELKAEGRWDARYNAEYKRLVGLTRFNLYRIHRNYAEKLSAHDTWEDASEAAEDFCLSHQIDILGKKSSKWRKQPASEKQRALCKRKDIWEPGMSKGKAAQAITHFFARKALRI